MKLKRIAAYILTVALLLSCAVLPIHAETPFTVTLSQAEAAPGETAALELSVSNNTDLAALSVRVYYPADVMTCDSASAEVGIWADYLAVDENAMQNANANDTKNISDERADAGWAMASFSWVTAAAGGMTTASGVIGELTFTVNADAEAGAYDLEVEVVQVTDSSNENLSDAAAVGGSITVASAHSMQYVEAKEPTCTEDGNSAYWYCADCGKYFLDEEGTQETTYEDTVIPAVEHNYEAVVIEPTCTEAGSTTYTCACGDSYVEEIPATGHTEVIDEAVAPTCTETGLTEGSHCGVCGEVIVAQEVIEATGHDYEQTVIEPTCTEAGSTTYTCACGESYVEEIPATGHNYENGVCTNCGEADPDAELVDANLKFYGVSLSMQDYIGLMPTVMKSAVKNYDRVYATIERDGTVTEAEAIDYSVLYIFEAQMLSTQMCDEVTITLYGEKDGKIYKGDSTTTSVREQCMNRLNETDTAANAKTKRASADMLNYGAAVQLAFNVKPDDLANSLMTDAHQAYATQETPSMTATKSESGSGTVNPYTIGLSMQAKVELQPLFLKKDMSAYEAHVTVGGETTVIDGADFDMSIGYPVARIAVKAAELRNTYEISVYEKSTNTQVSMTYTCSVEALAAEKLGSEYEDVAVAMMKYGDAIAAL